MDRVIGLGVLTGGIGSIIGYLWKRHHILTIIKYTDDTLSSQIMAVDFLGNIKYAQPLIYNKMLETQRIPRTSSKLPSLLFPLSKPPDKK